MNTNLFIDVCVRAEGEEAFLGIVEIFASGSRDFKGVPNVSYREQNSGVIVTNKEAPPYDRTLDKCPSPYLTGEFEYLLSAENHEFQAIVETNRGCPFLCTFCYWGKGGNNTKYRFKDLDTVFKELEYLSSKKVEYIFNADSNFGMHARDFDIAKKLVELKLRNGYPEKFRTCWGKNTSQRIFKIASLLQYHELDKGVTLARQSNSDVVLKNIKRDNIKLEAYSYLESNFNVLQVPIYAELILGLPGETVESWIAGINDTLDSSLNNQIFIYQAEVYPNTELGSAEYQDKFGIKTTKIKLNEIHCSPRLKSWITEYQEIITSTSTMTKHDWQRMTIYSLALMLLHSMKAGLYVMAYLKNRHDIIYSELINEFIKTKYGVIGNIIDFYYTYTENLLSGEGRGLLLEKYSDVYLEAEEAGFLMVSENREEFYKNLEKICVKLIGKSHEKELSSVINFQKSIMPSFEDDGDICISFDTNIPEYLYRAIQGEVIEINTKPTSINIYRQKHVDMHQFSVSKVIRARKSGTVLWPTNLSKSLKEEMRVTYSITDFDKEEDIKISLFKSDRVSYKKFNSLT